MSNSKVLIVWGMHRSGTSMLASWLAACGLDIGRELLGSGLGNTRGHYEDTDFLGLHERILRDNKIHCGGLARVGPLKLKAHFISEMKALVEAKSECAAQWGWKEPRTCLFYKEYIDLAPEALHLVVFRDYRLVVESLVRRRLRKYELRNSKRTGLKVIYYRLGIFLWRKFLMHRKAEQYLKAWTFYNENLLKMISVLNKDKFFILDCKDFMKEGRNIFGWMDNAGLKLSFVDPDKCVEPSLMTTQAVYMHKFGKDNLLRADAVYKALNKLASSNEAYV